MTVAQQHQGLAARVLVLGPVLLPFRFAGLHDECDHAEALAKVRGEHEDVRGLLLVARMLLQDEGAPRSIGSEALPFGR